VHAFRTSSSGHGTSDNACMGWKRWSVHHNIDNAPQGQKEALCNYGSLHCCNCCCCSLIRIRALHLLCLHHHHTISHNKAQMSLFFMLCECIEYLYRHKLIRVHFPTKGGGLTKLVGYWGCDWNQNGMKLTYLNLSWSRDRSTPINSK